MAPSLLFGLPIGAFTDRHGRRRLTMIAADLGRAALFASIPACYALHALTLAQLYLVTFAAGTNGVERSRQRMHEHHRNVPYAAENRSRSPLVAGVTARTNRWSSAIHR